MSFALSAAAVGAVAVVGGASIQASAAKSAAEAQAAGLDAATFEQQQARESFEERTDPFRILGTGAISPLQQLLGIAQPNPELADIDRQIEFLEQQRFRDRKNASAFTAAGLSEGLAGELGVKGLGKGDFRRRIETEIQTLLAQKRGLPQTIGGEAQPLAGEAQPLEGLEEINPIVSFLRDQGFAQIQESAAARGRLGAGGTLQDLTRFNLDLSATVAPQLQNQRFNQLFNLAGLGSNVAAGQGTAGLQTGTNISNLLSAGGQAQARGILGQSQAITGGIQNLAGLAGAFPNIFGGGTPALGPAGTTQVPGGLQTGSGLFIDTGTF